MEQISAQIVFDQDEAKFQCSGAWSVLALDGLTKKFKVSELPKSQKVVINGESISNFDSAGALALMKCVDELKERDNQIELTNFSEAQNQLLQLVESKRESLTYQIPPQPQEGVLYQIGKEAENKLFQVDGLIILIGDLSTKMFEALGNWRRFQLPSIISNIDSAGVKALPIVALLSFLIGVVLAYQMGLQLATYGANIFIAYLSGMAIFREFASLITAIIVAGRTSSAFTAQIGSMKINEEVDALLTMGLSPTELLVVPKVIGLLIVFPLLIFWSDIFSIFGAMIMSKHMLGIGFDDFLVRLKNDVGLSQLMLGLYKAPVFALLIALVGCFQGFKVEASADSIGSQTTKSVVQALFLIIIADAAFSVIYSWMGL
ncbi:MlaE family ABC transporter permease [Legionella quateirensis]|uniref:ABC transporter permease n=1 Tax=Legionella quateirensis TaxID=45072 RepID=A0A378KRR6_9GAMM|nr:ABC transporter permease [Legionella quateirensis]KTD44842.1 ABC transporter permease [Legionella quateirensis]STY17252.1 putative ABC transport system permease [Legionella quateirensis]